MSVRNVRPFAHLRVHSTYSLGVGLSEPAEICAHARRAGYDAVAITDIHGTYGFVEFHRAARQAGIKPIYGVHVLVEAEGQPGLPVTLALLATNPTGLRNLCDITSRAARSREEESILPAGELFGLGDGLVALAGVWPEPDPLPEATREWLASLAGIFGERLFVEVRAAPSGVRGARLAELAHPLGIASVLTQDIRYVGPEKHQLIDLMTSAGDRSYDHRIHSERIGNVDGKGHGMKSTVEMADWYERAPAAFDNASVIASLVERDLLDALDPHPETEETESVAPPIATLRIMVEERLRERCPDGVPPELQGRVDAELEEIETAGLAQVFLQSQEIAERLRQCGVTLGPANGLRLQSYCAFLLGITSFDPYAQVERFLPGLVADPGAARLLDLQVPLESRERVVAELENVYDTDGIGYVPAVEHVTAARALRMVGDRMGLARESYAELLKIASGNYGMSLEELVQDNRRVAQLSRRDPSVRDLISNAAAIEGLPYGFVRSKRSVVVSPVPIREYLGLAENQETGERFVQATRDAFPVGEIRRVDIVTLTALSVVEANADGEPIAWRPTADEEAYRFVESGDLEGIYLRESPLTGRLARRFETASFADLAVFIALMRYRGGDASFPVRVAAYRTRSGPHKDRPCSGEPTGATNGWLLFRDQLRASLMALTGRDERDAEALLRRFHGSDAAELAGLRQEFMRACAEREIDVEEATAWFPRLLRLSRRVVRRQGVIAEALLVDRMLHLKRVRRTEFFAAALEHTGDASRRVAYLQALERVGRLLGPDVNRSVRGFVMEKGNVRTPLSAVPGLSEAVASAILDVRPVGGFRSRAEFDVAAVGAGLTLKEMEALEGAGALEGMRAPSERPPVGRAGEPAPKEKPDAASQLTLGLADDEPAAPAEPAPSPGAPDGVEPTPDSSPAEEPPSK